MLQGGNLKWKGSGAFTIPRTQAVAGSSKNHVHLEAKRSYGLMFYALDLLIILLNVFNALENMLYIPFNS